MKKLSLLLVLAMLASLFTFAASAEGSAYAQAPMLDAAVEAGELPPVEERLPEIPAAPTDMTEEDLALEIIRFMLDKYPSLLEERYKVQTGGFEPLEVYEAIAAKRGFMLRGGEYDYERCASTVIDEFRSGTMGRIMMNRPREEASDED